MTAFIKTMKLNHLSFPSANVAATTQFFERHLGFTVDGTWDKSAILKRTGFDVVIEHVSDGIPQWPRNFHLGFELPSLAAVHELYDRFKEEGVHMETDVFNNGRGSRFFCREPGGVMFEINTRSDASEQYRGTFDD